MTQHQLLRLPDGGRALAYPVASFEAVDGRLSAGMDALSSSCLLEGRLMQYPDGALEARYDLPGELLAERLQRPFAADDVCALYGSIADLIDALIERQMPIMNVRLATDEVALEASTGKARFVFLPLNNIRPDLKSMQDFFHALGRQMRGADRAVADIIGSYLKFFEAYTIFDIMAFSKHLKQLVVSAMCSLEPNLTIPDEAAAPESFPRGGDRTACLDVEAGGDEEADALQVEEPNDLKTTVLDKDMVEEALGQGAGGSPADKGTVVLDDEEPFDDAYADEHVIQSRQGLTGVLSDLDFSILDDMEPSSASKPQKPKPAERPMPEPEPKLASEPEPAPAPTPDEATAPEPVPEPVGPGPAPEERPVEPEHEPGEAPAPQVDAVEEVLTPASEPAGEPEPAPASEPALAPEPATAPAPAPSMREAPISTATPVTATVSTSPVTPPTPPRRHFIMTRLRTGETFEIRGRHFVVGKSKHSSFQVFNTSTVSRSHAIFCVKDGICTVTDDSSRNGTFVNGVRLVPGEAVELEDGDTVRMSDVDFVFEID